MTTALDERRRRGKSGGFQWTAGMMSSGYLSNRLGLPGFTGLEALMAPIVVGGGMGGLGLAIRFVTAILSASNSH